MSAELSYKGVGVQGFSVGSIKLDSVGALWTSSDRNSTQKLQWSKVDYAIWAIFGKYAHLRFFMKDKEEPPLRLDGFARSDYDDLKPFLANKSITLSRGKVNAGGINYGDFAINDGLLEFTYDEKTTFDISMKQISQCVLPGGKRGTQGNDVELQFHESDAVDNAAEDSLVEMRLYFPENIQYDDDDEPVNPEDSDAFTAETFQQAVMDQAHIGDVKGNLICELDSSMGTFLTPRGRYAIEMYASFMRMHGSKYDYKIQYTDISKLYLLEKPDNGKNTAFVISLDKPIRQGQQRYQHLVLQISKLSQSLKLNLTEEECQTKYDGVLAPEMEDALYKLIAKVFKALSQKSVYVTGSYSSQSGTKCVSCAMGASEGHLYPLNKSFIFIHKPTKVIAYEDIVSVEFQRYSGSALEASATSRRSFDLCVTVKGGSTDSGKDTTFSGIDKSEYQKLVDHCQLKKIKIRNLNKNTQEEVRSLNEDVLAAAAALGDDDDADEEDEEDDDYAPPEEESDEEADPNDSDAGGADSDAGSGKKKKKKSSSKSTSRSDPQPKKKQKVSETGAPKKKKSKKPADLDDFGSDISD